MDEHIEKWLYDIKIAVDQIDDFFEKENKSFENFHHNQMLKHAIERNLEIIGEATNRILSKEPSFPISDARNIVGLRNFIIHSYDNITDENIWGIVINYLPKLKEEVEKLLIK